MTRGESGIVVLLIDNFDSFSYNLYHQLTSLGARVKVMSYDQISLESIHELSPSHIVLGPGPRAPQAYPLCGTIVQEYMDSVPLLGVCLGHQCIGSLTGGEIVPAKQLLYGKTAEITQVDSRLLKGFPLNSRWLDITHLCLRMYHLPSV